MPFIAAPMLWSRLAGGRRSVAEREHSHGSGLKIGLQSPKAFDEIFWMLHWPEKFHKTHIDPWRSEDFKAPAQAFLSRHFAKIGRVRHPDVSMPVRYLSKNKVNIARLQLLPGMFPGCLIVVPLREPSAHAASLHRQHGNFAQLHAEDACAKRYMRDIGHFEFRALHRPMAFDRGFLAGREPGHPDYWLPYWITCFETIADHADRLYLIRQEDLRSRPSQTMTTLVKHPGLSAEPSKPWESYFLRDADASRDAMFDAAVLTAARRLYEHSCAAALSTASHR
jgi:hypothetical protein